MIFQHTWEKVLSGEKTQTRRIVKECQYLYTGARNGSGLVLPPRVSWEREEAVNGRSPYYDGEVRDFEGLAIYQVGKTYAVQPGRGKAAVARIRITDIRREDVRNISLTDVIAEGFPSHEAFWLTWCGMHDPEIVRASTHTLHQSQHFSGPLFARTAARYDAWVLSFELAKEG